MAEFDYRPTACRKTYRMVVVRKNISREKGEQVLFDDFRYFFYLTNDRVMDGGRDRVRGQRPLQPGEPARAIARRRAGVAGAGGHPGEQLGVHGDDGVGVEPEGVVGAAAAGGAGPLAGAASRGEAWVLRLEFKTFVNAFVRAAVPGGPDGPQVGVSAAVLEPAPVDLLPLGCRGCDE